MPKFITLPPAAIIPAETAELSISDEMRVSVPIAAFIFCVVFFL